MNNEKSIEKFLKTCDVPYYKPNESKIKRVKILNTDNKELINNVYNVLYSYDNKIGIEYNNDILWFKFGEYEVV